MVAAAEERTVQNERRQGLNVHFQQLAYLREVERCGTLTEAAARLHVTQPALSQSLAELERRLGTPLMEPDGRRRKFTEAGREVARFAAEVLGRAANLESWLDELQSGEVGTLKVGMIDAASLYFLPGAVLAFRDAHPHVRLELVVDTSAALLERLERFEIDLAFVVGPVDPGLESEEVVREELHIYAPPGASEHPGDADWALYPAGRQTRNLIDEGLATLGIRPRVTLESDNPEVLRQMVALGLGWSVLPRAVATESSSNLLPYEQQAVTERALMSVRRRNAPADSRAQEFVRLTREAGAELSTPAKGTRG